MPWRILLLSPFLLFGATQLDNKAQQTPGGITADQAASTAHEVVEEMLGLNAHLEAPGAGLQFEALFNSSATLPLDFQGSDDRIAPGFYQLRYQRHCGACHLEYTVEATRKSPELLTDTWVAEVPFTKEIAHATTQRGKPVGRIRLIAEVHVDDDGTRINRIHYPESGWLKRLRATLKRWIEPAPDAQ